MDDSHREGNLTSPVNVGTVGHVDHGIRKLEQDWWLITPKHSPYTLYYGTEVYGGFDKVLNPDQPYRPGYQHPDGYNGGFLQSKKKGKLPRGNRGRSG